MHTRWYQLQRAYTPGLQHTIYKAKTSSPLQASHAYHMLAVHAKQWQAQVRGPKDKETTCCTATKLATQPARSVMGVIDTCMANLLLLSTPCHHRVLLKDLHALPAKSHQVTWYS